ncbi:MAG: SDR family oxidoreductase [Planctomycetes bacterium]|nr:SDR family oxidoreductase [Planctomycetota bacterium]
MTPDAGEFADRVVVVSGGGWNIGRAIARAFAGAGARVVVASRNADRLAETVATIESAGGTALAVPVDMTDYAQVEALVATTHEAFGRVDVFAAIAGGGCVHRPIDEYPVEEWDRVVRQNLTSTFHALRAVLPDFRAAGDRGVFITCSGGGANYPVLGSPLNAYACAKAAIARFTDQMTAELWETDIRIHCLEPGLVWNPDTIAQVEAEERATGQRHPHREVVRPPDDAAELALWMASDRSRPLRGRGISVCDEWWRDRAEVQRVHETVHLFRLRRVEE